MSGGVHLFCCFLFGHSRLDSTNYPAIAAAVERHIAIGVHAFVVGRYGQFDALAARAVREAKLRHPQVSLCLLLPYYPPQRSVFEGFDESFYPPGQESVPKRLAIVRANRYHGGAQHAPDCLRLEARQQRDCAAAGGEKARPARPCSAANAAAGLKSTKNARPSGAGGGSAVSRPRAGRTACARGGGAPRGRSRVAPRR